MFGLLRRWRSGGVVNVSPAEAQALLEGHLATLLDVRSAAERSQRSIPGSRHIALPALRSSMAQLPKDRIIICQCASGMRSAQAARQLAAAGYDVRNLSGGIHAWQRAGLPTE